MPDGHPYRKDAMNAIRERLRKRRARRNVFRDIADLPHEQAAGIMRMLAYNGIGEPDILLALSERALATAPDRWKYAYENWARVYRAGRKVRVKTYKATIFEPMDPDLAAAVESAYDEE
jgi:hypothetical protein